MKENNFENQTIEKVDYAGKLITNFTFENCVFKNCNFSEANLSNSDFLECLFENCNWSNVSIIGTGLKNIQFTHCKLLGVDFSNCKDFLFQVSFNNCILNYADFFKRKLKKMLFIDCEIKEANFTDADLSDARFKNCNLFGSVFFHTNLNNADLKTSINYSINPEENSIKKAKFSYPALLGLFNKYDIIVD